MHLASALHTDFVDFFFASQSLLEKRKERQRHYRNQEYVPTKICSCSAFRINKNQIYWHFSTYVSKKKKKRETCEIFGCPSSEKISNSKTPALRQPKLTVFVWLIRWIINKCRHKHNTSKYCTHQYTQEKLFHGVNNTVLIWILYLIFRSSGLECTLWCPFDLPFVSGDILQMSVCSLLYK